MAMEFEDLRLYVEPNTSMSHMVGICTPYNHKVPLLRVPYTYDARLYDHKLRMALNDYLELAGTW